MLPKITAYVKCHNGQTEWIYFVTEDDDLLKKRLVRIWFQKIKDIISQMKNAHKKLCCIFKTMITTLYNTLNYIHNPLKYKKLYKKLCLTFLLDKVCL